MSFFNLLGAIVGPVTNLIDDLHTSDEERLKAATELTKIDASLLQGQLEVNKTEAQHPSLFVAGWRPAVGWVGAAAMAYQFVLYPLLTWAVQLYSPGHVMPPAMSSDILWTIVSGMLGIGGLRSFDKMKGSDTTRIS
ncbi:MAG: holin family protein [Magnetococcales bacterium]|nr:holin family protein [Magnetococcales bacterium]